MVLCEGSALACGGMDGAPAGVLAIAVPGEHQPSCVQTSLCTGCQKELPLCVVPQCPQGPPLLPLMQSPPPRGPRPQNPTLCWCLGLQYEFGSAALCHWANALPAIHVLKPGEEGLGELLGLVPIPELA